MNKVKEPFDGAVYIRCIDKTFETLEEAKVYQDEYTRGIVMADEDQKKFEKKVKICRDSYIKSRQVDFKREYNELVKKYNLHFDLEQIDYETSEIMIDIADEDRFRVELV